MPSKLASIRSIASGIEWSLGLVTGCRVPRARSGTNGVMARAKGGAIRKSPNDLAGADGVWSYLAGLAA